MANGIIDLGGQLSQIGDTFLQNRDVARQQAMRDAIGSAKLPDGSIDFGRAAAIALQFGSPQTAAALSGIQNQQAQRSLQERQISLQERQANEAARGYDYREVDDGQGGKTLVRIHKATGVVDRPQIQGMQETPTNPYAFGGKMTDEQSKAALYAGRMFESEKILRDPAVVQAATTINEQLRGALANAPYMPAAGARFVMSENFQKYDQAKRDFVNAVLRRESGAVISQPEFKNAEMQYFPLPGDTPQVIQQKAANRAEAIRGIASGAGRGYVPPLLFDQSGNLVPNPAAARRQQQQQPQGLPRPRTPEEARRLGSGAQFIDPQGNVRTVP